MPWSTAAAVIGGANIVGSLIGADAAGNAADSQAAATDRAVSATERQNSLTRTDLAPYREAGHAALTRLRSLLGIGSSVNGPIGQDYKGSLVDLSSGVPAPIQDLYDSDPNYKNAWDKLAQMHQAEMHSSYTRDSDSNKIEQGLRGMLPQTGAQQGSPSSSSDALNSPLLRKFTSADLNADPVYNSGLEFGLDEGRKAIERRSASAGGYDSGGTLKALTRFGNDYGTTKAEGAYGRFVGNQGDVYGRLSGIAGMGSGATTVGVNAGSSNASNLASLYSAQGNAAGAAGLAGANAISGGISNAANFYGQSQFVNRLEELYGGGGRTLRGDPNLVGANDISGARG